MKDDWWGKFITYDGWNGDYIAWDETQANELGRFFLYDTAKEAILEYAKTLNKKETKMDFQVGDKVVCLLNGAGEVVSINYCLPFPIKVCFDNGCSEIYCKNGYFYDKNKNPCLFHEGTEIIIKPAEPKRYPWVNLYRIGADAATGGTFFSKEDAMGAIGNCPGREYVDTIQLKPKREEK